MISYKQIKKAINDTLKAKFNIEINSKDIKEGFIRPSFFVEFDEMNRIGLESQIERSFTVRIYFFASDKDAPSIENMEVQEELENAFDMKLKVADRFFNVLEARSVVSDGVLQFEFEIQYEEGREIEEAEEIKELQFKNEVH